MDKLDGSMVHAAMVMGKCRLMTRAGITDTSLMAEELCATPGFIKACTDIIETGVTPIFEFTAPSNRIVIRYEEPKLTLIGARFINTGGYLSYKGLDLFARHIGVDRVSAMETQWGECAAFLSHVRELKGQEGYVLMFDPDFEHEPLRQLMKCKGEEYILKHRAKDSTVYEKNVLALILMGEIDDVLPLLSEEDQEHIVTYRNAVEEQMRNIALQIASLLEKARHVDRKTFAVEVLKDVPRDIRTIAFAALDSQNPMQEVLNFMRGRTGSQTSVDAMRSLIGTCYTVNIFFAADHHFGHAKMITSPFYRDDGSLLRPGFKTVEEMDEFMISQHNARVNDVDHVYFLGDVTMDWQNFTKNIARRLKGKKRLCIGNHDSLKGTSLMDYFEKVMYWRHFKEEGIVAAHMPVHTEEFEDGRYTRCVHGHLHYKTLKDPRYACVSMEMTNYAPVHFDELSTYFGK
jgi:RNA ligase